MTEGIYVTSGRVTTLPGATTPLPVSESGMLCINCEEQPATVLLQGETDSMGCERNPFCDDCLKVIKSHANTGRCDWCRKPNVRLSSARDYDEGMSGPTYEVCLPCIYRQLAAAQAELETFEVDYFDHYDI